MFYGIKHTKIVIFCDFDHGTHDLQNTHANNYVRLPFDSLLSSNSIFRLTLFFELCIATLQPLSPTLTTTSDESHINHPLLSRHALATLPLTTTRSHYNNFVFVLYVLYNLSSPITTRHHFSPPIQHPPTTHPTSINHPSNIHQPPIQRPPTYFTNLPSIVDHTLMIT